MNDRLKTYMAVIVGTGWLFNLIAPAVWPAYAAANNNFSLVINAPLMMILGSLFANRRRGDSD